MADAKSPTDNVRIVGHCGLCSMARRDQISKELLTLFIPTEEDKKELREEGYSAVYWGGGDDGSLPYIFTTLRQTIVLFMAAINGEL